MTNVKNMVNYKCRSLSNFGRNKLLSVLFDRWGWRLGGGGLSMGVGLYTEVVHMECHGGDYAQGRVGGCELSTRGHSWDFRVFTQDIGTEQTV